MKTERAWFSYHEMRILNCAKTCDTCVTDHRVSYRKGGGGGGRAGIPSPPEILKLSMVIIVLSQVLNNNLVSDCIRSNLRGSKFKIGGGGLMRGIKIPRYEFALKMQGGRICGTLRYITNVCIS